MSETSELVLPALAALCKRWPDGVWTRRNVGAARYRTKAGRLQLVRFGMSGMADITGIWRGLAWELEAKLPGEPQSEHQEDWQRAVERGGGIYILFHDVGALLATIDRRWRARERDRSTARA